TGALGLLHPGGDLELGLPIRTAVVRDGVAHWHAGGGIVADSDPERELAEAWLKTAALRLGGGGRPPPPAASRPRRTRALRRARVAARDRGLLHGDGVYDTWRTYGGEPFAVPAHMRRLAAAARVLALPRLEPAARWVERSRTLVRRNRLGDATVRLTLTRGDA